MFWSNTAGKWSRLDTKGQNSLQDISSFFASKNRKGYRQSSVVWKGINTARKFTLLRMGFIYSGDCEKLLLCSCFVVTTCLLCSRNQTYYIFSSYSNTPIVLKCINCSLQTTHDYMGIRKKKEIENYIPRIFNRLQTTNAKIDQHRNHNIPVKHGSLVAIGIVSDLRSLLNVTSN